MNNKVSIIVPTYKRSRTLHKTIESLLTQSYTNIEIIIVDDNGIENIYEQKATKSKVETLNTKHNNVIKYISLHNNSGAAIARNEGIKNASGGLISFLDDDDTYHPNKIEKQVDIINTITDPRVAFVKCEMAYIYNNGKTKVTNKEKYFQGNQLINHVIDQHAIVGTPTFMFKREALVNVDGFYDTPIRQEYMLILKILAKGYIGVHHNDVLVDIKTSFDGISVGKNDKKAVALANIYNERKKFSKMLTEKQIYRMETQYLQDMFRWYSTYNLKEANNMLRNLKPRIKRNKYFFSLIIMLSKYYLGNTFYKLKYILRV
ncbi:TPA: glycosyltransferase family 2 protein [Providencia rettgeri]